MKDSTVTISLNGKELARVRVLGSDNPMSDVKTKLVFVAQSDETLPVLDMRPQHRAPEARAPEAWPGTGA